MLEVLKRFERAIVFSLLVMLMLAVLSATLELDFLLFKQFMKPPRMFLLDMSKVLPIFSLFLTVLMGVGMLEIVKYYLRKDTLHVEVVFLVSMIAAARKIIVLDYRVAVAETLTVPPPSLWPFVEAFTCSRRPYARITRRASPESVSTGMSKFLDLRKDFASFRGGPG